MQIFIVTSTTKVWFRKATQSCLKIPHQFIWSLPLSLSKLRLSLLVKIKYKSHITRMYLKRNKAICRISIFGVLREAIGKSYRPTIGPPIEVYKRKKKS
jgi:hypothetical protein